VNRPRTSHCVLTVVLGIAIPAACLASCSDDRGGFATTDQTFEPDASVDAPDCRLQCSLDGRAVIEACSGQVVETCPEHLACGGAKCIDPCAAAAEDRSSNGCDFYFQSPQFSKNFFPSCHAAFIVNTSNQPVGVSLELAGKSLDITSSLYRTTPGSAALVPHTGPIPAGESVVLFLSDADPQMPRDPQWYPEYAKCPDGIVPTTLAKGFTGGTVVGSSYRVRTNVPVALTSMYPFGGAASFLPTATLVFPVASWAKDHVVVNGWGQPLSFGKPGVQIVASEDDTEVTIVPKVDIENGVGVKGGRAGRPWKYMLGQGQYLQLAQEQELTGSFVTSNKPTTTFGGHGCSYIGSGGPCDILGQQIPAFERWGSEYVGVGYRPRLGNEAEPMFYRIVAARDGTMLEYDPEIPPGAPTTLNAGEVARFKSGTGDAFVVRTQDTEHPIYVAAHMTSANGDPSVGIPATGKKGDPEFVNVVPAGQYLNAYSFYADPTYADTSLVVVRAKLRDEFKDVWLECAGNLTEWKPVGTGGNFEYTRVDLARAGSREVTYGTSVCRNGLQRMKSDGPFTATLWGWDTHASYAYPGGMAQRKLVEQGLDVR